MDPNTPPCRAPAPHHAYIKGVHAGLGGQGGAVHVGALDGAGDVRGEVRLEVKVVAPDHRQPLSLALEEDIPCMGIEKRVSVG